MLPAMVPVGRDRGVYGWMFLGEQIRPHWVDAEPGGDPLVVPRVQGTVTKVECDGMA